MRARRPRDVSPRTSLPYELRQPGRLRSLAVAATCAVLAGLAFAARVPASVRAHRSGTGAISDGSCQVRRPQLLCPDLVMSAPAELHLDRTTLPGHVLLRASSSIDNHGRGPLELRARRSGRHRWEVYQAVYDSHGRAHLFRTGATLVFKRVPGERYGHGNVGSASYWKLRHAAAFQLWSLGLHLEALRLVRTGPKVDYCLRDLVRTWPARSSPTVARYPACSQDPRLRRDKLGTSVGWSDVYPYEYPQQWIDVTRLHGRFAFVQCADPDGMLIESDHGNDLSETFVQLPSGRVLGHRTVVSGP